MDNGNNIKENVCKINKQRIRRKKKKYAKKNRKTIKKT